MAGVVFKNIVKEYPGGVVAVHDFNMEIADKEFIVLVGPSGCGKSTTLRMIAGLEDITSGELYIGERLINNVAPKDRDIAMVFQNYALYPHMTVYKNMAFALEIRKEPKEEIDRKVREAAKVLGIEEYLNRKPKALSGGQRQRVALGRAMVREPAVFLLDEPLSNLDAKLRASMRTEIAKLHKRLGTTFVYVTHDQTEAMTMGDRIVVMKDGYIQQIDKPQELYDNPCNMFVASFIGTPQINFIDAILRKDAQGYFADIDGTQFRLEKPDASTAGMEPYVDKTVVMGVRPEDVYDFVTPGQVSLNAKVEVRELMGAEVYLYINYNGTKITARVGNSTTAHMDKDIQITFDLRKLMIFDKETEAKIY